MLSSVLRSRRAVAANVAIMRAFVRHQETLALNRDLALKFKELEGRVDRHDGEIGVILDAIKRIIEGPAGSAGRIGFQPPAEDGKRGSPQRPLAAFSAP